MVKDYARKTFPRKRRAAKSSHHLGLYLLIIFLCSLFFIGLYNKKIHSISLHKAIRAAHHAINSAAPAIPEKPQSPVFEFYTLLPKNRINKPEAFKSDTKHPNENYVLQVGTFQNQADADSLKAKLLLLGFDVAIKNTTLQGKIMYRVNVGPYSSLAILHTDQNRLHENHIDSILQRVQP